jgi:hypothetical protein
LLAHKLLYADPPSTALNATQVIRQFFAADLRQPQAEIVLQGVADRAVHLQGDPGRPVGGVAHGRTSGQHLLAADLE